MTLPSRQFSAFTEELSKEAASFGVHAATAAAGGLLAGGKMTAAHIRQREGDMLLRDQGEMTPAVFRERESRRFLRILLAAAMGSAAGAATPLAAEKVVDLVKSKGPDGLARLKDSIFSTAKETGSNFGQGAAQAAGDYVKSNVDEFAKGARTVSHEAARGAAIGAAKGTAEAAAAPFKATAEATASAGRKMKGFARRTVDRMRNRRR